MAKPDGGWSSGCNVPELFEMTIKVSKSLTTMIRVTRLLLLIRDLIS
jgi:hypothetical protein